MRLGITQPYFFPYIGYFSLIKNVDRFIILDTVQYISRGWMNRNSILKPDIGWQYIGIPVRNHPRYALIPEVLIAEDLQWKSRILNQLQHYKTHAPYFGETINLLDKIFGGGEHRTVCDFNIFALKEISTALGIQTPIESLSALGVVYETPKAADEWCLNICKAIPHTTEYWNATPYEINKMLDRYVLL